MTSFCLVVDPEACIRLGLHLGAMRTYRKREQVALQSAVMHAADPARMEGFTQGGGTHRSRY